MCKSSIQAEKEMKIKLNFVPALSFLQDPDRIPDPGKNFISNWIRIQNIGANVI